MRNRILAAAVLTLAAGVAFSNCWSPPVGSQQFLTDTCVENNSSQYQLTEYSESNYFAACAYVPTYGCNLCKTRQLEIDQRVSLWQGAGCTSPCQDPGSWKLYEYVTQGYYVAC
jgi:hypothetical protein